MKRRALFLLAVLSFGQATLSAESKPLELKWSELAPLVASHRVEVAINGGGKVSGEAIAVRDETLVIDAKSVSGTTQFSKGNAAIPRTSISLIKLERTRGTWGRSLGTTLGVITGLAGGGYAAFHTGSGGEAVAVLAAITGAVAVGGYYAGKALDKRTTRITIIP